jgi:alanine-glyoxylate transaminase/serine-glyoxylate transaminase/serine-pyruvate transaminase
MTGPSTGRHFLQIPGPTNVPDRVLRAIARPTIDHRGVDFQRLLLDVVDRLRWVFRTNGTVVIWPGSGTGASEAALLNTLSPGERVLAFETGYFSDAWVSIARRHGLDVDYVPGDWRHPVDYEQLAHRLAADEARAIKAVLVVHNETSTGVRSDIGRIRRLMDEADHPALLLVDAVSSLASSDYRHDEWRVDVTFAGSQKGLMLPPGLAFHAISEKALAAAERSTMTRAYWSWAWMMEALERGSTPYTPGINLVFGLQEALRMLEEETLEVAFERHQRLAAMTRAAAAAWGFEIACLPPEATSDTVTTILPGDRAEADAVRAFAGRRFNVTFGSGLGRFAGAAFRIGHLGDFNDALMVAALAAAQWSLVASGARLDGDGVAAAMDVVQGERLASAAA